MKLSLDRILLGIAIIAILYLGPGAFFDHQLSHESPYGYLSSDAFQHQIRTEWIQDQGQFVTEAPYISKGFDHIVARYPPVLYHIAVLLGHATGLQPHDSVLLVVLLLLVLSAFAMYLLVRSYQKSVALLVVPFGLLLFAHPMIFGIFYGHWPALIGQALMLLVCFGFIHREKPYALPLIGIGLVGVIHAHTSEAVYAIGFLAAVTGVWFLRKKISFKDSLALSGVIIASLVLSWYYLIIFFNTWAKGETYEYLVQVIWNDAPGFYLPMWGLFCAFLIVGLAWSYTPKKYATPGFFGIIGVLLICWYSISGDTNILEGIANAPVLMAILGLGIIVLFICMRDPHPVLIYAGCMLVFGLLNYIGFSTRAFQQRFFWPITLGVFIALGMYWVCKRIRVPMLVPTTSIVLLLLFGSVLGTYSAIPQTQVESNPGLMHPLQWEAMQWVATSTPQDASVYFMHGDVYGQDSIMRNVKRYHRLMRPEAVRDALVNRSIGQVYQTKLPGDSGGGIRIRDDLFNYQLVRETVDPQYYSEQQNICGFDYFFIDKISRQQAFAQYNQLLRSELERLGSSTVFENQWVVVVQNANVGGECLETRTF